MKKLLVVAAVFGLFCIPVFAQDVPKAEIFGGYSLVSSNDLDQTGQGFAAALEGNITGMFGIVGEFGYYDFDGGKAYTFMGGPRIGYRAGKVRPFGHALFGGTNLSADAVDSSETYFSMALGGGLDFAVNQVLSIRPAQVDLLSIRFSEGDVSDWSNNLRYSAGVVITF